MATRFWVGGAGTWSSTNTTNWSATSGGAGGASVPVAADTVTFDGSSGSGKIVTASNVTVLGTTLTLNNTLITLDLSSTTTATVGGGTAGIFTLTQGTLTVNTVATGTFVSSNTNTRQINFLSNSTTAGIVINGTSSGIGPGGTVLDISTATGFAYSGRSNFLLNEQFNTSSSLNFGSNAGATSSNAVNIVYGGIGKGVGTPTLTLNGAFRNINLASNLSIAVAIGTNLSVYGDLIMASTGSTTTASGNTISMVGDYTTGSQTLSISSTSVLNNAVTFNNTSGGIKLGAALTMSSTLTLTYTAGILDLNNFTLTCGNFSSNNSNFRKTNFGTSGNITVSGSGASMFNMTGTNFNYTGTPTINISNNSATASTITMGAGSFTEAKALHFNITTGTYALTFSGAAIFNNLIFTGFAGSLAGALAYTIYGNLNFSTGMTVPTATVITSLTFARTLPIGQQTLTTNAKTLDFPINLGAATGTIINNTGLQLLDACTMGSTRTFTHNISTLNLNNFTLSTGNYVSSYTTNNGAYNFGTSGSITVTGTGSQLLSILSTPLQILGTPTINVSNNSATASTITLPSVSGTADVFKSLFNVNITTGTYVLTASNTFFNNIDFTGFTGSLAASVFTSIVVYGNIIFNTSMTIGSNGHAIILNSGATGVVRTFTNRAVNITTSLTINQGVDVVMQDAFTASGAITITGAKVKFAAGTTNTAATWTISGVGSTAYTVIESSTPASQYFLVKSGGGTVVPTNLVIRDSNVSGGTWTATSVISGGNNTGWTGSFLSTANTGTPAIPNQPKTFTGFPTVSAQGYVSAQGSQVSTQTGTVTIVTNNPIVTVTGNQLSLQTGTVTTSDQANVNVTDNQLSLQTGTVTVSTQVQPNVTTTGNQLSTLTGIVTAAGNSPNATVNVTSTQVSIQTGTVTTSDQANINITGNQLSTQTGTVTTSDQANINITGNQLSLQTGVATVSAQANKTVTGNQLSLQTGTVSIAIDKYVSVTGNQLSTQAGTVSISAQGIINVTGNELATQTGNVSIYVEQNAIGIVTGNQLSTQTGTVSIAIDKYIDVSGQQLSILTGNVKNEIVVNVLGSLLTIQAGKVGIMAWNNIIPVTNENWNVINPNTSNVWNTIYGTSSTIWTSITIDQ